MSLRFNTFALSSLLCLLLTASTVSAQVLINEVDADQTSTDNAEFVELYDGGTGNTDLSGLVLVFYNGSDDQSYEPAFDLDGFSTNADGFFVVCGDAANVANCDLEVGPGTTNLIQNGADAVTLFAGDAASFPNDTPITTANLIDAVVYDTNDNDDSGLAVLLLPGEPQLNEDENGSKDTHSNQRVPDGSGGARVTSAFQALPPTPGAPNEATTTVQFDMSGDTADETDGTVTIDVSIANPDPGAATTVEVALTGGTATNGTDLITFNTQFITFPAGNTANESFSVTLTDDAEVEGGETLVFSLQNPSGGDAAALGSPDTFTLTIADDDFAAPTVLINEVDADQTGTDNAEFVELYDGGTGNTDLSGLVLVFYNGSDDQSYEPAFDLDGFSTNADGFFVVCGDAANVANCDLEVGPGTTNLIQNGADAVTLFAGDAASFPNDTPITTANLIDAVVYDTNDNDDSGLAVLLLPGEPQLNEDENLSKDTHSNQRIPDGSGGARMTSTFDALPPTPGTSNGAAVATTTVQFALSSDTADEASGTVTIDVSITDPDAGAATTVEVALTGGTATNGTDLTTFNTQFITFPAGNTANESFTITLTDDGDDEGAETLVFMLQNPSGGASAALGSPDTFTLTINDDDFVPPNVVINEVDADQTGTDNAEFVELYDGGTGNTDLSGLVLVFFNGSDDQSYEPAFDLNGFSTDANGFFVICGDAANVANCALEVGPGTTNLIQNGADAVALFVGTAASFPNDTPATTADLLDVIVYDTNDDRDTGLLAALGVSAQYNEDDNGSKDTHSNQRFPDGTGAFGAAPPSPGTANNAILKTVVAFQTSIGTATEGEGTVDVEVTLTNPDDDLATTVEVVRSGGTATEGADYVAFPLQTLTFAAGDATPQTVSITLIDDGDGEFDETITLMLQNVSGGTEASLGSRDTFTLTLVDNDGGIGEGTATLANAGADALNGTTYFDRAQSGQAVAVTITGTTDPLTEAAVTLPDGWTGLSASGITLSGDGFAAATASIEGQMVTITGAQLTATALGTVTIDGLNSPTGEGLTTTGENTFVVRTARDGAFLNTILASPTALVAVPITNLRDTNTDAVPLDLGARVAIRGTATVGDGTFHSSNLLAYMQDETGGMVVYAMPPIPSVQVGQDYLVVGTLTQFNGLTQIEPTDAADVIALGTEAVVAPKRLTIAKLLGSPETYEGQLIQIDQADLVSGTWPEAGADADLTINDGGTRTLTLRIDADTDLDGSPTPDFPLTLTGVIGQFDSDAPYRSGYQILPRSLADLSPATTIVQFAEAQGAIRENDGTLIAQIEVTILNPDPTAATTVEVARSGGTAVEGTDVATFSPTTLTFPAGDGTPKILSLTIIGDNQVEESETLDLKLQNAQGGNAAAIGSAGSFTLTILDDDANKPPSAPQITAPEPGATLVLEGDARTEVSVAWNAATDPDGDPLSYTWSLALDEAQTNVLLTVDAGTETSLVFDYQALDDLLANAGIEAGASTTVYHQVLATDGMDTAASPAAALTLTRGSLSIPLADVRAMELGTTVSVAGTVTRALGDFLRLQDATGGIVVRQTSGGFFDDVQAGNIAAGDLIELSGVLSEFGALLQINDGDLVEYRVLSRDNALPEPIVLTLAEIAAGGEAYESMLVQVSDLMADTPDATFAASTTYTITDPTLSDGSVSLRIPNSDDTALDGTAVPPGVFTFVGVLGQFSFGEADVGYQLNPIAQTDILFSGVANEGLDVLPATFTLQGNYPNPFNPTTTVRFDLPATARVSIQVYDLTGRMVMALPEQALSAGPNRTLQIEASGLPSGVYLYRVVAQTATQTHVGSGRMTLIK